MSTESNAEYPMGTVATFSCDAGTELFGDTTRTCQSDHTWTNSDPTCQGEFMIFFVIAYSFVFS